jgi:hypothetical protein
MFFVHFFWPCRSLILGKAAQRHTRADGVPAMPVDLGTSQVRQPRRRKKNSARQVWSARVLVLDTSGVAQRGTARAGRIDKLGTVSPSGNVLGHRARPALPLTKSCFFGC